VVVVVVVADVVVLLTVVVVDVTVVVDVIVDVLVVVVVAMHLSNVLSWNRVMASFKYATALHESLKSLTKPDPEHPNTRSPLTSPLVSWKTMLFSSADAAMHVPPAACSTKFPGLMASLHSNVTAAPGVHVSASSCSRRTTVSHRIVAGCDT
jgi:hypothetical protein